MKIIVEGLPGYDGEYPFEFENITNDDLRTIKQMAGVRAGEIVDALKARDNDLIVAFGKIALSREGKEIPDSELWQAAPGVIRLDTSGEEDDALPPDSSSAPNGGSAHGGSDSRSDGGHPENAPSPTGSQDSATGSASDPAI